MFFLRCTFQASNEAIEDETLNMKFVVDNVLTNTDLFLENHLSGSFRTWHVILIISAAFLTASRTPNWTLLLSRFVHRHSFPERDIYCVPRASS